VRSALAALLLAACGAESPPAEDRFEDARPFLAHYAAMLEARYREATERAEALDRTVRPIVEGRADAASLEAARAAWIAARGPYLETEIARFYGGPIDAEHGPEERINGWPLDEAYLDTVLGPAGPLHGGLIHDRNALARVDRDGVRAANLRGGEQNVSMGFHAIEFLLWGQDRSADGPGDRPFTDFLDAEAGGTLPNADRRRAYLGVVTEQLAADLASVRDAWSEGRTGYRAAFLALAPREAVGLVLRGLATLSSTELAGERIEVPYLTREPEDEHSCFSDTTSDDHRHDAEGIALVYLGRLVRSDGTVLEGPGLGTLVASRDPELDRRARSEIERIRVAMRAIPSPFDRAIQGEDEAPGRQAVRAALRELRGFTATLVLIARRFGVSLHLVA
jgi:putative iron-regulated protein